MGDNRLSNTGGEEEPDVRLELVNDGTRRIWAIYSEDESQNFAAAPEAQEPWGFSPLELLRLAIRGRRHIAFWVVGLTALGLAYLQFAQPSYHVVAQLLVAQRAVLSNQDRAISGRAEFLSTQAEIISSPVVIAAALDSLAPDLASAFGENPVAAVMETLSATPVKGTNVLAVSYAAPGSEQGVALLNGVIGSYQKFVREVERADHDQDLSVFRRREGELREQLDVLNAEYAALRADNETSSGDPNAASLQNVLLKRLTDQMVDAQTQRVALENELHASEQFGYAKTSRDKSQSWERLNEELWRAEADLAGVETRFTEKYRPLTDLSQRVATLRAQVQKAEQQARHTLERELGAARSTEKRLEELYHQEVTTGKAIEVQRFEQQNLEAKIEQAEVAHRSTLAVMRDAELTGQGLAEGRAKATIHILEAPISPLDPAWPRADLVLLPCIVLGVIFGLGTAWLAAGIKPYLR